MRQTATAKKFNSDSKTTMKSVYHPVTNRQYYRLLSAFGFGSGLLASFAGMLFITIYAVLSRDEQSLNYIGTFLLLGAIPALLLGAYFTDKPEIQQRKLH